MKRLIDGVVMILLILTFLLWFPIYLWIDDERLRKLEVEPDFHPTKGIENNIGAYIALM